MNTDNRFAQWFGRVTWIGIAANMLFVIPLLFFPSVLLGMLGIVTPTPPLWAQASGLLLLEISILYIPAAMDPYRYHHLAWMSVLVTRGGGSSFFFIAVLVFHQQVGFLSIASVDALFGLTEGILLWRAFRTEGLPRLSFAGSQPA